MQVKLTFARFNQTEITLREILGTRDYRLFNCCQGTLFGNPLPVEWFFLVTGSLLVQPLKFGGALRKMTKTWLINLLASFRSMRKAMIVRSKFSVELSLPNL